MQNLVVMLEKSCFDISIRKISEKEDRKENVLCIQETFSFHISRNTEDKKYRWIILLERYEDYKMIVISFWLSLYNGSKGIKKYKRNKGYKTGDNKKSECIDPFVVLRLFKECFSLCTERKENKEYSFCFYALDDEYIPLDKREDMNKRMSAYYTYLQRDSIVNNYQLKQMGKVFNNLYVGYNEKYCKEEDVKNFIKFYEPILYQEIEELYKKQPSQKL